MIIKFAEKDADSLLQLIVETYLHYGRENKEKLVQEFRPIVDDVLMKKTSLDIDERKRFLKSLWAKYEKY